MINTYDIYLISDSTGETLERIFLAIKAQFKNFKYKTHFYSFTRTENQISKILEVSQKQNNVIVLYTIVDNKLARHLSNECSLKNIPCFGILGDLIISFSKLLDQKALNVPSRQHIMDDEYYKKIEAIQFTMNHDDGNSVEDIDKSDIILLGVSRTSKTPTSIYLANKGMKISNIPLVNENSVPDILKKNPQKKCIVGLTAEPDRLVDLRKNRMQTIKDNESTEYTNLDTVQKEMEDARKLFQKYKWPSIDVTRKSVEETAASVLKIHDIFNQK
tara:strand:+ start:100 stop:921 length:822 start_codon:yes stop_codon:yes gene_type:complete